MADRTAPRLRRAFPHLAMPAWNLAVIWGWAGCQIRWKIVLPYAFLVVLLAASGTYLTTSLLQGSLNDRFENQLVEASRVSNDAIVRQEDAHLAIGRSVAFTQGLPQAIQARDASAISPIINAIAVNDSVERIDVLDATGARLTGTQLTNPAALTYGPAPGDDPASWSLTSLVLNDPAGAKYAQIVATANGPALMTATPTFDGDTLVGAVLVGTSLQTIVDQMKGQALADITIYDFNGNPISSTFVADPRQAGLTADSELLSAIRGGEQTVRESRTVWGRRYELVYGELIVQDHAVGYLSAALPSDFIFSAGSSAQWKMTLLFGLAMAGVLGTGLVLARSFTNRIQRLVATAERVTAGDLTARTHAHAGDELDRLATCIDRMTDRLEGQYMATMRALASAVAGNDPYTVRHSLRVGQLATILGRQLGVDELTLAQLEIGGYLHDVGKIGVRDTSVMGLDTIAPGHRALIDSHPHIGVESPNTNSVSNPIMLFIGGRSGSHQADAPAESDQFAIVGRIVAVADLYDALTADRADGPPMTSEEALDVLRRTTGKLHFGTVEALARVLPQWERSQGRGSDYARRDA